MSIRLGVNIDHVATLRQARREGVPDPLVAARDAMAGGADGITAHLREDRRHIHDDDIRRLRALSGATLNMEMAASADIVLVAEEVRPAWACLVSERREELTTEGGLDVFAHSPVLSNVVKRLRNADVKISFFVDADPNVIRRSAELGADAVEIHTGPYAAAGRQGELALSKELERIRGAAEAALAAGLLVNAGHGLSYENVARLAGLWPFNEFNIGFAIVARALRVGMKSAVAEMKEIINTSCAES